jgi:hypothetical protein
MTIIMRRPGTRWRTSKQVAPTAGSSSRSDSSDPLHPKSSLPRLPDFSKVRNQPKNIMLFQPLINPSIQLANRAVMAPMIIYPDAGHGGIFQFHADFVPKALEFLAR